jgi:cell division protein FtsL
MRASPDSQSALTLLLVLALVASGLALVWSTHEVRAGYARLQALELQRWQLQEEYTRLLLESNTWAAPHRINQIASDKLSMSPPELSLSRVIEP